MSSTFINIPNSNTQSWKPAVASAVDLPMTGNNIADARSTKDTLIIYEWNGSAWVAVGGGSGVSSFNTLTGAVTISAGANITFTPSGNNISIAASGGGTPGGSNGDLQYNNSNVFGGDTATTDGAGNLTMTTATIHGNLYTGDVNGALIITPTGSDIAIGNSVAAPDNRSGI